MRPVYTPANQAFEKAEIPPSTASGQPLPTQRPFYSQQVLTSGDDRHFQGEDSYCWRLQPAHPRHA